MERPTPWTKDDVFAAIRGEIRGTSAGSAAPLDLLTSRLAWVRSLQQEFRAAPLGGRLLGLKRLMYWFSASAFDRQAKAVEGLLATLECFAADLQRQPTAPASAPPAPPAPPAPVGALPEPLAQLITRAHAAITTPAEMLLPERVLLFALVYGLAPRVTLEVGTFRGGSATIIVQALDALGGDGRLICVDPQPRMTAEVWAGIAHRATLIDRPSPAALSEAAVHAPQGFDLALIDGDHGFDGALADIEGALPRVRGGGYLLFHDCHHEQVAGAIDEALRRHPAALVDCGILSTAANPVAGEGVWGGLRLLRKV